MRKDSVQNKVLRGEYPSKEEFEQYYITENHSQTESAKHFGITRPVVQSLVEFFGTIKSDTLIAQLNAKNTSSNKNSVAYKLSTGEYPCKEDFVKYYVTENHSKWDTAEYFAIPPNAVLSLCSLWDIHKTNEEIDATRKKTCLERFGCESNLQNEEQKKRIEETCLEKYGVRHISQSKEVQAKCRKSFETRYGVSYALQNPEFINKAKETNKKNHGVNWACQLEKCKLSRGGNNSKPNKAFEEKLNSAHIEHGRETTFDDYNFDFKVQDILVEINPWITHQSSVDLRYPKKEKDYHFKKTEKANEKGFHCIHVFDWDDQDKIIEIFLKSKEKCYARQCEIKTVSIEEEKEFLRQYHLQGYIKSDICIGLYYNSNLVQLMSFGKPRYNKNYEYELLRLCSSYQVIGGANKIFKHFLSTYQVKNVISYCDLSKFSGNVYNNLGFTLLRKAISKHWYSPKLKKHITDNLLRQKGFDQLLGNIYGHFGKGTSNEELMLKHGFYEIYDAGQATYIFENN